MRVPNSDASFGSRPFFSRNSMKKPSYSRSTSERAWKPASVDEAVCGAGGGVLPPKREGA